MISSRMPSTLFDIFDHPSSSRTNIDVMNLHRVYYDDLQEVDAKLVLTLASGIALYEKGIDKGLFLPARERGAYLAREDYRQFILWAAPFAKAVHGWMLHKPGIVAEMLSHRRSDAEAAETFWRLVFKESHPDADHETRELSRTLKDWAAKPKVSQDRFRRGDRQAVAALSTGTRSSAERTESSLTSSRRSTSSLPSQ